MALNTQEEIDCISSYFVEKYKPENVIPCDSTAQGESNSDNDADFFIKRGKRGSAMDEKDKREIEEIFKHHIGILSEDFQSKLDIVVEGHQILNEKADRMDKRLERVEEGLYSVEGKVVALDVRMNVLEKKVDSLDKKVDSLDKKVDSLDKKVGSLDKKVDSLDRKVDTVDKKVGDLAADLAAHRADTESHRGAYRVKEGGD